MALRTIRVDQDPILRKKSREITRFDQRLKDLSADMLETMYDADGIGLAAPQIGILKRLIVIDLYDDNGAGIYLNPEITHAEGEQFEIEGCLSLPGLNGRVKRPYKVAVKYQDLEGKDHQVEAEGMLARAFCHEIDHLNGILFTDMAVMLTDEEIAELQETERVAE